MLGPIIKNSVIPVNQKSGDMAALPLHITLKLPMSFPFQSLLLFMFDYELILCLDYLNNNFIAKIKY